MADDRRSPFAELAVVRGWPEARETIAGWVRSPVGVVGPWVALAAAIGMLLLALVWIVGANSPAIPSREHFHLLTVKDWQADAIRLFRNNMLVLALHGFACLAGFIVYTAMRDPVKSDNARLDELTRTIALVAVLFVPIATVLSIGTQAWVLGSRAAVLAVSFDLPVGTILRTTTLHSIPELAAVFLPLAAAIVLQVRGRADQLLAATLVSVVIAVPVIAIAAVVEAKTWSTRLSAARADNPSRVNRGLDTLYVDPSDHFSADAYLKTGAQIGEDFTDRAAAEAAAARAGRAVVVLQAGNRILVNELLATRSPHFCDKVRGMRLTATPIGLEELSRLRYDPDSLPNTEVLVFVEGSRRIIPAALDPGDIEQSFKRTCPNRSSAG